jgi:hypothetical protein
VGLVDMRGWDMADRLTCNLSSPHSSNDKKIVTPLQLQ